MNSGNGAIDYFTFEIITLILLRLPIQSLCRFKCVSKEWFNFISNPKFARDHLNLYKENRKQRLFFASYSFNCSFNLGYLDSTDVQLKVRAEQNPVKVVKIWSSCDGLLLVSNCFSSLFLVNPSTGEFVRLPLSPFVVYSEFVVYCYGLGYDSSIDDYKVVQISLDGSDVEVGKNVVSVYSHRGNSWKSIESSPYRLTRSLNLRGAYANGALHWLGESDVIALNLASESFYKMPLPEARGGFRKPYGVDVIVDCLCYIEINIVPSNPFASCDPYHVWVMKEYGVSNSWVKFSFDFSGTFIHRLIPSRTGKLVLCSGTKIVLYDPQEEKFEDLPVSLPHAVVCIYEESLIRLRG